MILLKEQWLDLSVQQKGKKVRFGEDVVPSASVESSRGLERVFGLAKTYKILQREFHAARRPLSDKIIYVCFALLNLRTNIIPKHC